MYTYIIQILCSIYPCKIVLYIHKYFIYYNIYKNTVMHNLAYILFTYITAFSGADNINHGQKLKVIFE